MYLLALFAEASFIFIYLSFLFFYLPSSVSFLHTAVDRIFFSWEEGDTLTFSFRECASDRVRILYLYLSITSYTNYPYFYFVFPSLPLTNIILHKSFALPLFLSHKQTSIHFIGL